MNQIKIKEQYLSNFTIRQGHLPETITQNKKVTRNLINNYKNGYRLRRVAMGDNMHIRATARNSRPDINIVYC